jgi:hypothetical protein
VTKVRGRVNAGAYDHAAEAKDINKELLSKYQQTNVDTVLSTPIGAY